MSPLPTSSSGSTPPTSRSSSSAIVTPSRTRSRPARQVFDPIWSSWYGARCAASNPQRIPVAATHSSIRARSSSSRRKRRRTGSQLAKSITCDAVTRVSARSRSSETAERTGFVWRRERSASRNRRSGIPSGVAVASVPERSSSPAPNVAWRSGAKASMSGHITITSRGSSVGSSASRCRIASRSTSTCRARPWQACTCRLRSDGSRTARLSGWPGRGGPGCQPVGADVGLDATQERVGLLDERPVAIASRRAVGGRARSRAALRGRPDPRWRGAGCAGGPRSGRRGVAAGARWAVDCACAIWSHSTGDGWRRNRWTSRAEARASSTST